MAGHTYPHGCTQIFQCRDISKEIRTCGYLWFFHTDLSFWQFLAQSPLNIRSNNQSVTATTFYQLSVVTFKCLYQNYTGCVTELGDFKNVMNSKPLHLFGFNTYKYSVNIKPFGFPQFNSLKTEVSFPKITSIRWFRHSVGLILKSLITSCGISTGIHSTSSRIRCFNSWTV
jgi:hypothetical protein